MEELFIDMEMDENFDKLLLKSEVSILFSKLNLKETNLKKIFFFFKCVGEKIKETYLDNIETEGEIRGHIKWCIDKVVEENFQKYNFEYSIDLENMIYDFFVPFLYEINNNDSDTAYLETLKNLFNRNKEKMVFEIKIVEYYHNTFFESFIEKKK